MRKIMIATLLSLACVTCAGAKPMEKGVWINGFEHGFFTEEEVKETVRDAKTLGVTHLFVQMRKNADACYMSNYEPHAKEIAPDFDALACLIKEGHAEGLKIHAWVNACRIWRSDSIPENPNHIANLHKDWYNKTVTGEYTSEEGVYIDPAIPEARAHLVKVVSDIATHYDIDGLQLDYIRYPGKNWGYSDYAVEKFNKEFGRTGKPEVTDPDWVVWRADQVTKMVREIRTELKAVRPDVVFSVTTIAWGSWNEDFHKTPPYYYCYQDWYRWVREDLIDLNVPMNYRQEFKPDMAAQFRKWTNAYPKWNAGKPVYVGIGSWYNSAADAFKQVKYVENSDNDGYVFYMFNKGKCRDALLEYVKSGKSETTEYEKVMAKGMRLLEQNQIGMAIVQFKKAAKLESGAASPYVYLGKCAMRENNKSQAKKYFEKACALDPTDSEAREGLEALK